MNFINDAYWSLLIPQIPNLQLVSFVIIKSDGDLSWNGFTPANDYLTISGRNSTIFEIEYAVVYFYIPESN